MQPYKLDRNSFKAHTFSDADNHSVFYKDLSVVERLKIANYLNSIAFNFNAENPPRMDKNVFKTKSWNK